MADARPHFVVLSGSGISAESGLATFRGAEEEPLWQKFDPMKVATPEAWARDPALVLEFYNLRRQQVRAAQPNAAHRALVRLEEKFQVSILTQNVDDLHERAGSRNVLHLHGRIMQGRSERDPDVTVDLNGRDIQPGDKAPDGEALRPNVVWFGEMVPAMEETVALVQRAAYLLVVGTSLTVHPAAGLARMAPTGAMVFLVDPSAHELSVSLAKVEAIAASATEGVPPLVEKLLAI